MPPASARDRFVDLLRTAVHEGSLARLTLGKYRGSEATLEKLFVRPVVLKNGPHLAFVWRHSNRDITKNHPPAEALALLESLTGGDFRDAHLFAGGKHAQLETKENGPARLTVVADKSGHAPAEPPSHDREKEYLIPPTAPWLQALGVTNPQGRPREGMADKFRQLQKFAELLSGLVREAFPDFARGNSPEALRILDAGSGKGYLTFALAHLFGPRARIHGIEQRPDLVELCNRVARDHGFAPHLEFKAGLIAGPHIVNRQSPIGNELDVLIALHACDTATDDALARGVAAGARLLVVAPCCQKELRPQLTAPPFLRGALRHGIFRERQAEFVTDALRAELLEWAGYRTKVFEFISTEHTAKNLMIAAIKAHPPGDEARAARVRELAVFYGIRDQRLAAHLQISFSS